VGTVAYEQPPVFTFQNVGLIDFSYNSSNGRVTYDGLPDLSAVQIGNKFRDSTGVYYNVVAKDNIGKTVDIVDSITLLPPPAITFTVVDTRDGSIYSDIGGSITNYALAFFYPGNQGLLLP
jgi:hypothetical protein